MEELKPLYKEFDMIAKVKTPDTKNFSNFVTNRVRSLNGVLDTKILQ